MRLPQTKNTASPQIQVNRRAVGRVRGGHLWIYRSDLLIAEPDAEPGSLVAVVDERSRLLGSALYSSSSQIALRMISPQAVSPEELPKIVSQRVTAAIAYRRRLNIDESSNAYRLVFSEADQIPGLIVDRYADVLTAQFLTQAMDRSDLREAVLRVLVHELEPASVIERVEPRIRELESLPPTTDRPLFGEKMQTIVEMNGLKFIYDALAGQKTGAFLDQRENYAAAARYARGRALDVFCYQGGFAVHLAGKCSEVTGVDISRPALEQAEKNAELNAATLPALPEWIEGNAFDLLRDYSDLGERYDTIVLDPPAFAKSKRALPTALKGYKELNLRALKMLRPEGLLVTCSCSHHVSTENFLEMLTSAAVDAHRTLRIVEVRGQSKDHPIVAGIPETSYLKCVLAITN
ncbi:MAG TPA: class I SAM-dependent rRNA methyltransferase [Terriglobales bacterium]